MYNRNGVESKSPNVVKDGQANKDLQIFGPVAVVFDELETKMKIIGLDVDTIVFRAKR